ncbi:hypothetical protein MJT46_019197 [Ovis ammon polii x Ovis aries]|nr:hypothetical protein MJT46_019197 [Ovis ammon polii x Ovis aries]
MECRALAWSWCQSASAQLSVSPVALQAVEAAAAELALESPLGHLDHVIQPHGQCLLIAGARASPVHAEEVQGGGADLEVIKCLEKLLLSLLAKIKYSSAAPSLGAPRFRPLVRKLADEGVTVCCLGGLKRSGFQWAPEAVEAAAAELALESPLGHLDHVIQPHGQCLLIAGARASPVHAEEVQGGGADLEVIKCLEKLLLSLLAKIKYSRAAPSLGAPRFRPLVRKLADEGVTVCCLGGLKRSGLQWAPEAVEAAAAELALESPLGHLDHVIQPHGQCLLVAGARASPVHAEEVQGGGAGKQVVQVVIG